MGVYDTVRIGDKEGQVKVWDCQLNDYEVGDNVPDIGISTYSIAMRDGGYVCVIDNVIEGWLDEPLPGPVLDKWGHPYTEDSYPERKGNDVDRKMLEYILASELSESEKAVRDYEGVTE